MPRRKTSWVDTSSLELRHDPLHGQISEQCVLTVSVQHLYKFFLNNFIVNFLRDAVPIRLVDLHTVLKSAHVLTYFLIHGDIRISSCLKKGHGLSGILLL